MRREDLYRLVQILAVSCLSFVIFKAYGYRIFGERLDLAFFLILSWLAKTVVDLWEINVCARVEDYFQMATLYH
jgi:hypothetical protein